MLGSVDARGVGEWGWWTALVLFVVAAGTGAFFRFGAVYGWTGGLALEHIRHAHSHLMYFGWGTPALMVLIWQGLPSAVTSPRTRAFRWVLGATLGAAVLAYPPFLLFGYSPVQIGAARMPIAVVGAGLNVIGWYAFAGLYGVATRTLPRSGAVLLWDGAVGALVFATFGAWGLSLLPVLGVDAPLVAAALTHVFLDLFSEGWFVLGALGVVAALGSAASDGPPRWALGAVLLGLPFTAILGLPEGRLPSWIPLLGRAGGTLVAVGLLAMARPLARTHLLTERNGLWGVPIACLLLKAGAQLAGSVVPGLWLGTHHGLRILYLHLMLLGFLTLVLVAGAQVVWGQHRRRGLGLFYGSVVLLLATLLPLTAWVPAGAVAYEGAAWAALGPSVAGIWLLADGQPPIRATMGTSASGDSS